jgi:hypothetical protein
MDEQVRIHLQSPHPNPLPGGGEGLDVSLPAQLSVTGTAVQQKPRLGGVFSEWSADRAATILLCSSGAACASLLDQRITTLDLGMAKGHDLLADIYDQFT